ncbi:KAP family NTPase [Pseudomonas capsici]|uniref:KAP family NTPase n=1 Tax=Pseudomonas capsici TaxID=2810614 RepID=UPI0021F130BC|nr:KAP family NTPase [Pseudomonas capsici]MCV4344207.1 KAP family NTPase [Pseudomonas capsici]
MSDNKVVINLSVNEAGVLEDSEGQLQQNAYLKLRDRIEYQLDTRTTFSYESIKETDITYPRVHSAILVEGGRGSGKTTFLLKSLEKLKNDKELQLSVLRLIDPTLIETKENIVVVILSAIGAALEHAKGDTHALDEAREALAEGLGLLDGIGSGSAYGAEWEDAKWVMSQGLRKAKKGRDFEKKLGIYIEHALKLLNKKAFVLTFDDVDTNFAHGYLILETVRKYLTHPGLVVILSGDIELYGRLLRKNIYKAFGEQVLNHDLGLMGLSQQSVGGGVSELEEQYLLKIAPPQNRISMVPLGGLKQYLEGDIEVGQEGAPSIELREWTNKSISVLMHETPHVATHPFFNLVATEPLRLVIGYMRALDAPDETKYSAIFTAFSTRLSAQGVSADLIFKGDLDHSLRAIFGWMIKQEDAPDLVKFGVSSDVNRAIAIHCLALLLAQKLKGHVGNTLKALLGLALPVTMMRRPVLLDVDSRNSLFRFLWSQSGIATSELAARLGAIDRVNDRGNKSQGSSFGSVGLASKVASKTIIQNWYGGRDNQIEDSGFFMVRWSDALPERSKNWWEKVKGNNESLPMNNGVGWFYIDDLLDERCGKFGEVLKLVVSRRFNKQGEVMRSVSALSLFGVIADLIFANSIDELGVFSEFSVIPPFGGGDSSFGTSEHEQDEEDGLDEGDESVVIGNQNAFIVFSNSMKKWHRSVRNLEYKISPGMLGHLALRLHDDLLSLDEKATLQWRTGEILHRQIVCILHGMLAITSSSPGRKGTSKTSDQAFIDLLRRFTDEKMPVLMGVLLSCPLIWMFLNPKKSKLFDSVGDALLNSKVESYVPRAHMTGLKDKTIKVSIGPVRKSSSQVEVVNFYELLNVVPRYAAK